MKRELDHLARFFHMAVDYAKQIGFTGQFLIEPKPKEPTKHQYDSDAAACLNFLRAYDLLPYFKLNLETNHATLAGHTMMHELDYAGHQNALGSIDANTGDLLLGWDTDQFPTDYYLTAQCMLMILKHGGLKSGGVNFDAKVRRESFEPIDLFHAHVGGMDAFARGLKIAAAIRADGVLDKFVKERYSSWDGELARRSKPASPAWRNSKATCWAKAKQPPTKAVARKCSRTLSTCICNQLQSVGDGLNRRLVALGRLGPTSASVAGQKCPYCARGKTLVVHAHPRRLHATDVPDWVHGQSAREGCG